MRNVVAVATLGIVAFAATGSAQGPRAALEAIGERKVVRVTADGRRVQGRIATVDAAVLVLTNGEVTTRVNLGAIDSVWQRKRSFGTGALIGGAIGAAAFTGFLHFIVKLACESSEGCASDHRRAWGYGIVLGGAGGALVGAGIGGLIPRWDRTVP